MRCWKRRLCNARRYERSEARRDLRSGSYERKLRTRAGEVRLKVPKLRRQAFETAIIERYRWRESSVEEALIEMYLAGVSVRRVEDITEALWGTRVSLATVSNLNQRIYQQIEAWRNRPVEGRHPSVYLDGIVLKRSWAGEVRNVSLLVAISVNAEGYREILGIVEGAKEDKAGWSGFLAHLKGRGLAGVRLRHRAQLARRHMAEDIAVEMHHGAGEGRSMGFHRILRSIARVTVRSTEDRWLKGLYFWRNIQPRQCDARGRRLLAMRSCGGATAS
jgi:transposase-like protein